jgi:hypothetical protein
VDIPVCTSIISFANAVLRAFARSIISKACLCFVTPSTALIATTVTKATVTTNLISTVNLLTTQTALTTDVFTTVVTDTVDAAVFQEIDFGENCPGFGGNVTPITAVAVADINGCLRACFGTAHPDLLTIGTSGCTLAIAFLSGASMICELYVGIRSS